MIATSSDYLLYYYLSKSFAVTYMTSLLEAWNCLLAQSVVIIDDTKLSTSTSKAGRKPYGTVPYINVLGTHDKG